jgi:hypothetical protein
MMLLRWVMAGLGAVLGVVLLSGGHPVVGVVLIALACTRMAMLVGVRRRRRRMLLAGAAARRGTGRLRRP